MSEIDAKLADAVQRLRENYAKELANRKCIILLEKPPQPKLSVQMSGQQQKKNDTKVQSKSSCLQCQATTMKGVQCSSKAKPGCNFCGRHMQK